MKSGHLYQEGGMLSADGSTRAFDASSTGTVFSDGAAMVVLRRLEDAVRDGAPAAQRGPRIPMVPTVSPTAPGGARPARKKP